MPTVIQFPKAKRTTQTLATLCEPDRRQDEALLRVIAAFEKAGIAVVTDEDPVPLHASMIVEPHELVAMAEHVKPSGLAELIARDANVSPSFRSLFTKLWGG